MQENENSEKKKSLIARCFHAMIAYLVFAGEPSAVIDGLIGGGRAL